MLNNLVFRSLPYFFVSFFIFFEFTPSYFFENEMIKPYMFFTVLYCWVSNDFKQFSPISLFILCTLYDLIQGGIVGITCLFFLILQYSKRRNFNDLISYDFKETWIKFILSFTMYLFLISLSVIFFSENRIVIKNLAVSFIFSIALFPLFFSMVDKLSLKSRNYNE